MHTKWIFATSSEVSAQGEFLAILFLGVFRIWEFRTKAAFHAQVFCTRLEARRF